MPKVTVDAIRTGSESAGVFLNAEDAARLEKGENVPLRPDLIKSLGGCSGIKIVDLGHGCGLYLNPFPPSINVCCQT